MGYRFNNIFSKIVVCGDNTQYWHDTWVGSEKLKLLYPRLYELEKKKSCRVAERIKQGGLNWRWKSCPVVAGLSSQVEDVSSVISSFRLQLGDDRISCPLTSDGMYRVNALRRKLDYIPPVNNHPIQISWCKLIPIKISTFTWRPALGRIPTAMALSKRGIHIDTCYCSSCIEGYECANHVLVRCLVWKHVFLWCGIIFSDLQNIEETIHFAANWGRCPKKRKRLTAICYGTLWNLWRAGNDRLFQGRFVHPSRVVDNIKASVFTWIKYRSRGCTCN
uniref:Reverse transcriptase zinc-binding domain-containing protein n=1 Tax=Lactuca sativa TaxID=4236 RepID=A0A9R1X3Z5_LACSA|nr:hypothetical protein LSAT_V11C700373740 [Lactuca sativa]